MTATVSTQYVVQVLNGALATDREAMTKLLNLGIPCNEAMAADPIIPTSTTNSDLGFRRITLLTPLSLITAAFGQTASGRGRIGLLASAAGIERFVELDDDGRVL